MDSQSLDDGLRPATRGEQHAAKLIQELTAARAADREAMRLAMKAMEDVAFLDGLTLLGPDSKRRAGDYAPCYHEMGAAAAFSQAAAVVGEALAAIRERLGEEE